jgi:hypothetical protein
MAPILQCPDCGTKHPLGQVPSAGAFACAGCGRVLKVPDGVGQRAAPQAAGAQTGGAQTGGAQTGGAQTGGGQMSGAPAQISGAPFADPTAAPRPVPVPLASAVSNPSAPFTPEPFGPRTGPAVDEQALGALSPKDRRPVARLGSVPWWMRFLLWIVAIPLGFLVVFLVARAFSVFTTNQLSDVFLANNTSRFWPVARLLPFVALVTAAFVQGGVYGLARVRGRSRASQSPREVSPVGSRSRVR